MASEKVKAIWDAWFGPEREVPWRFAGGVVVVDGFVVGGGELVAVAPDGLVLLAGPVLVSGSKWEK